MSKISKYIAIPVLSFSLLIGSAFVSAQGAPSGSVPSAKDSSPHDLEGYWVALVTEDWRFRMVVAEAGDYQGISLTPAGSETANAWDPAADEAAGEACRAYGVGGIMRMPTRLHISWASDNVLSIETDAGKQTRLLKFGSAQDTVGAGSWQGISNARWDLQSAGGFGSPIVNGTIEVNTTEMKPGYLRRNGVPYSEESTLVEYFEMVTEENGDQYLIVISVLEDPVNLTQAVLTSTNFKREFNGSKWDPSECMAR